MSTGPPSTTPVTMAVCGPPYSSVQTTWEEHSRIVLQHFTCLGRRGCRLSSVGAPSLHVSVYLMAGSESDGLTMMTSSALPRPGPGGREDGGGGGPGAVVSGSVDGVSVIWPELAEGASDAVGCVGPPPDVHAERLRVETKTNVRIPDFVITGLPTGFSVGSVFLSA